MWPAPVKHAAFSGSSANLYVPFSACYLVFKISYRAYSLSTTSNVWAIPFCTGIYVLKWSYSSWFVPLDAKRETSSLAVYRVQKLLKFLGLSPWKTQANGLFMVLKLSCCLKNSFRYTWNCCAEKDRLIHKGLKWTDAYWRFFYLTPLAERTQAWRRQQCQNLVH